MVLFTLYNVVLTFESTDEILSAKIQMKAIEFHRIVVLFIMIVIQGSRKV